MNMKMGGNCRFGRHSPQGILIEVRGGGEGVEMGHRVGGTMLQDQG